MLKFTRKINGWEVTEKGQVILSEIETIEKAVALARVYREVLTEFKDLSTKRAA